MAKWTKAPFERCLEFIDETHRILVLSIRGICVLRGSCGVVDALAALGALDRHSEEYKGRHEEATHIAELAESEVNRGFPLLHAHAVVALWAALESLIDDLMVTWIVNEPSVLEKDDFSKIRVPLGRFHAMDQEDRARLLVDELKRELRSGFGQGASSFEQLIGCLGLSGPLDDGLRRKLVEVRQIRNLLVHKGGTVDRRFAEACPWTGHSVGDKVAIDHAKYHEYHGAVHDYILLVVNRVRAHFGIAPYDPATEGEGSAARESGER